MPDVSAELRWLTSGEADRWLLDPEMRGLEPMALAKRLRRGLSGEQARLVAQQLRLRQRAKTKFAAAERMFFTPLGLEQATDEAVARYKAQRFAADRPGADLCCGVGGDLLALAARARVLGVDRDATVAWLVAANLAAAGSSASQVCVADATQLRLSCAAAWHIDPDRRPAGRKTSQVAASQPSQGELDRLLAENPHAAIKLSPAAEAPPAWRPQAELEWISRGRECRQQVAWFGSLASTPGQRRATLLGGQGEVLRTLVGGSERAVAVAARIGRYVYEPDAAVLAAGLAGGLAAEHGLQRLTAQVAYYTGDSLVADPALAAFELLDELPCDLRRLRALCRERGVGRLEVKKRGVDLDPRGCKPNSAAPATWPPCCWFIVAETALTQFLRGERRSQNILVYA